MHPQRIWEEVRRWNCEFRHSEPTKYNIALICIAVAVGVGAVRRFLRNDGTFSQFLDDLGTHRVVAVELRTHHGLAVMHRARVVLSDSSTYNLQLPERGVLIDAIDHHNNGSTRAVDLSERHISSVISSLGGNADLLFGLVFAAVISRQLFRGRNERSGPLAMLGGFDKSTARRMDKGQRPQARFGDVAGMAEAKFEIEEFVDFLRQPQKYTALGARMPRGALLAGPPGTGKTLLARACAGEAGVPFFSVSGSEFTEMFVGVGAARVRDLFAEARKAAPAIIFIDEIDALAAKRSNHADSVSEADSTLNQLLVELDGFTPNAAVVLFCATNRKELLDPALLRPGRIDRSVDVALPDLEGRREIYLVHLQSLRLTAEERERHAYRLASLTPGFSGADIANVCNEAAIQAVRRSHPSISEQDFEAAVERVLAGVEKRRDASDREFKTVAIHECGHGVVSWFLPGADPLLKLTIVPRAQGSLGFAQYLPSENSLVTREELFDKIAAIMAGRCAEEEFFGEMSTGAHDDFKKAYTIAHRLVTQLGMSPELANQSLETLPSGAKNYSEDTSRRIDEECNKIINHCVLRSREYVQLYRDKIVLLSDLLLEKKTITLRDIVKVLGPRPFPPKPEFEAYLNVSTN